MDKLCQKVVREDLGFKDFFVAGTGKKMMSARNEMSSAQKGTVNLEKGEMEVVEGVLSKRMGGKKEGAKM